MWRWANNVHIEAQLADENMKEDRDGVTGKNKGCGAFVIGNPCWRREALEAIPSPQTLTLTSTLKGKSIRYNLKNVLNIKVPQIHQLGTPALLGGLGTQHFLRRAGLLFLQVTEI